MTLRSTLAILTVAAITGLGTAATATPTHAATVAPGSPLAVKYNKAWPNPYDIVLPPEYAALNCATGVPGEVTLADGTTKRVLITAGHCLVREIPDDPAKPTGVEVAPAVYAPLEDGYRVIGYRDQATQISPWFVGKDPRVLYAVDVFSPDWGTVDLAEDVTWSARAGSTDAEGKRHEGPVITGIRDYPNLPVWGVSFAELGQPICYYGSRTGEGCGMQVVRTHNHIITISPFEVGDSGGVQYDPRTGEAIGVTSKFVPNFATLRPNTKWERSRFTTVQRLDRAIEDAYDIPDGQVNERFRLPAEVSEQDQFVGMNEMLVSGVPLVDASRGEVAQPHPFRPQQQTTAPVSSPAATTSGAAAPQAGAGNADAGKADAGKADAGKADAAASSATGAPTASTATD